MSKVYNKNLIRFWFRSSNTLGVGITAFSRLDAETILKDVIDRHNWEVDIVEVIEDIDIRELDQGKVIPNMNPPSFRGVWFPMFNENLRERWV